MDWCAFAEILVEENFIDKNQLAVIKNKMSVSKVCFWEAVYNENTSYALAGIIKERFGMDSYFRETLPEAEALNLIDAAFAFKHMIVPVKISGGDLLTVFADPLSPKSYEELELAVPYRIVPVFTPWADIKILLDSCYGKRRMDDITNLFLECADELSPHNGLPDEYGDIQNAPSVKMADSIIDMAILKNASDIHIEPFQHDVRVRFRVDGRLAEYDRVDTQLGNALISRLKVMGGMDISEKRLPQDGRFLDTKSGIKMDFRLSTVPVIHGEKAVIRLLYEKTAFTDKSELGFSGEALKTLDLLLKNTHGAILLTGPTGSGKTTTMAAFLRELNTGDNNIITVEDPVENVIPGTNQININRKAGFTFPGALRSILRQDPDIIMIGEIRDSETAQMAIRSALTGHLVLSTLHANDTLGALHRLVDMGVPDYLAYTAIKGVVSQRLVRKLCGECKREVLMSESDARFAGLPEGSVIYEGKGCKTCDFTGYAGRFAIYEILVFDGRLLHMFNEKMSTDEIKARLLRDGMKSLWDCGLYHVRNGNTSFPEFLRAVFEY